MLQKTRGIVLSALKYGETSVIVRAFTEAFGLQSYLVNSVRTKKPKFSSSYFQPLNLLDMVIYHKENQNLKRVSELKIHLPFHSIPFENAKITVSLFMSEILMRTTREESANPELFAFLFHSILYFDHKPFTPDFHLRFILLLMQNHGLGGNVQDFQFSPEERNWFTKLTSKEEINDKVIPYNDARRLFLMKILRHYSQYYEGLADLKSLKVLGELFR